MKLYASIDEYIQFKENNGELKPKSIISYKETAKRLKNFINDIELSEIKKEDMRDFVNKLEGKPKSVATSTKNLIQSTFDFKEMNIKVPKLQKLAPSKSRMYEPDEINKIEEFLLTFQKNKSSYLAIPLCLFTGIRIGEALGLQWLDIDLERNLLSISKNSISLNNKRIIQTPKTESSIRTIAFPNQLSHILAKFCPANKDDWGLFVVGGKSEPAEYRVISRSAETLIKKMGLKWKGFHAFRHAYATRLLEAELNPRVISDLLGHSNTSTTLNIYSHPSNSFKRDCVQKVFKNEIFDNNEQAKETAKQIDTLMGKINSLAEILNGLQHEVQKLIKM